MELAAEAIRGHKSAHSLATGPVIADPAGHSTHQTATSDTMTPVQSEVA